jgi:hypothetical protein
MLISLLFICTFPGLSMAQGPASGQFLVAAVDKYSTPLPEANVLVQNMTDMTQQTMMTNSSGMALFTNISKGRYNISVERHGQVSLAVIAYSSGSDVGKTTVQFPNVNYMQIGSPTASPTAPGSRDDNADTGLFDAICTADDRSDPGAGSIEDARLHHRPAALALAVAAIGIGNKKD